MKNRIGIVGGGQLGRMLAFEAKKMGFIVNVIDPTPQSPAGQVADHQIIADYNDEKAIRKLAKISDFLTFEIELANAAILDELSDQGLQINPSAKTLTIIKDKLAQKTFLKKSGIPVADFVDIPSSVILEQFSKAGAAIESPVREPIGRSSSIQDEKLKTEFTKIAEKFGYPFLLKARFDGYDGRGNVLIKKPSDIDAGLKKLDGRKIYVEKFVPFIKELAIMVAQNTKGEITTYPVVETVHKNNICHIVYAPAKVDKNIAKKAEALAKKVMQQLKGAGVFGIEMFLTKDGKVLVNEIAPRVHNSGHYTIESNVTNQFEQHIRAITGLPLGITIMKTPAAVMINLLGDRIGPAEVQGLENALNIPGITVHIYGKNETKPERKMGHITAIGKTIDEAYNRAIKARKLITI